MHRFFFNRYTLLSFFLLCLSCQDDTNLISPMQDAGEAEDAQIRNVCTPESLVLNPNDVENCGTCGFVCDTSKSNRCESGICMCGESVACPIGQGCRQGQCIDSDRFTLCDVNEDCQERQECVKERPEDQGHCLEVCEFDDACIRGFACIEGACSFVGCTDEVCDGFDNDCDGIIDNNGPSPLAEFCVGGDPSRDVTTLLPPCVAGVRVCAGGRWTECSGGLDPIPEQGTLACNGSDDDCDGCTDGTWSPDGVCEPSGQPIYDILFINDVSGSMTNNNEIVRAAVTKFSGRLAGWEYMWALASLSAGPRGSAVLIQNLTDLTSFTVALGFLSTSGSLEPSWDAVYEAASGELGVSWRPGSIRIIILFTDEEGQSVRSPVIREAEMCASLINGETFIAVVPDEHREDFDDCAVWVNLPDVEAIISSSLSAGSGERCLSFDDCFPDEGDAICFDGTCVSQPVVDMVNSFNRVIIDPCAR